MPTVMIAYGRHDGRSEDDNDDQLQVNGHKATALLWWDIAMAMMVDQNNDDGPQSEKTSHWRALPWIELTSIDKFCLSTDIWTPRLRERIQRYSSICLKQVNMDPTSWLKLPRIILWGSWSTGDGIKVLSISWNLSYFRQRKRLRDSQNDLKLHLNALTRWF